MKRTRFLDHWRHTYEGTYPNRIDKVKLTAIPGLGSGSVGFKGGIHAICGQNGSGKSTLLNCISALVSTPFDSLPKDFISKATTGVVSADLHIGNTAALMTYDLSTGLANHRPTFPDLVIIDLPKQVPMILDWIRSTSNFGELLESLEPRVCPDNERAVFSYISGRRYFDVKVYEIEDAHDFGTIPYFEVKTEAATYSSPHMGLGEFSIFYIIWCLNRIKKTSLVLIEEPESFIYPKSQRALVNYLAKLSDERKLWILMSTHSEHILERIPIDHVTVLLPQIRAASMQMAQSQERYFDLLGLDPRKRGALLFEDSCAIDLTALLLGHFGSNLSKALDLVPLGGDSEVLAALKVLRRDGFTLHFVGVLDGDKRQGTDVSGANWPVLFLPGTLPPDEMIFVAGSQDKHKLAQYLGRTEEDLVEVLGNVEMLDHHDAIVEMSRQLNITYEQLFFVLFRVWIQSEENAERGKQFVIEIEKAINQALS